MVIFYTKSILVFGNEKIEKEMRGRIIAESVLHKNLHLIHDYLERGLNKSNCDAALKTYETQKLEKDKAEDDIDLEENRVLSETEENKNIQEIRIKDLNKE